MPTELRPQLEFLYGLSNEVFQVYGKPVAGFKIRDYLQSETRIYRAPLRSTFIILFRPITK